ncbi:hypothetical protein SRHO_G00000620 [Serrasalmus rhombeus]
MPNPMSSPGRKPKLQAADQRQQPKLTFQTGNWLWLSNKDLPLHVESQNTLAPALTPLALCLVAGSLVYTIQCLLNSQQVCSCTKCLVVWEEYGTEVHLWVPTLTAPDIIP